MTDADDDATANNLSAATTMAAPSSILSEKVNRALSVRTDTPALQLALKALSQLQQQQGAGHSSGMAAVVDSRSVRSAMEQDALQQAFLLQEALQEIVHSVTQLRKDCSRASQTASLVRQVIHTSVIPVAIATTTSVGAAEEKEEKPQQEPAENMITTTTNKADPMTTSALAAETKLAQVLSEAFAHRDQTRQRLQAVHAFLEKFDLSAADAELLDQYQFQDANHLFYTAVNEVMGGESTTATTAEANGSLDEGWAFLSALERVRHIRTALHEQFGGPTDRGNTSSSTTMSSELNSQSALRMMESLAAKQEAAYERLYHWLQQLWTSTNSTDGTTADATHSGYHHNHNNNNDTNDEWLWQHEFVLHGVYSLRPVPAFYRHTLETVASTRRAATTRRFLLALTTGYQGQAPLEVKAHDAVQYVGDMLAFAFKAFSVEADLARGLLHYEPYQEEDEDNDEDNNKRTDNEEEDEEEEKAEPVTGYEEAVSTEDATLTADGVLGIAVSGLARPLKARILQVIATLARRDDGGNQHDDDDSDAESSLEDDLEEEEGTATRTRVTHLYEICGLLLFYASTMEKGVQKLVRQQSTGASLDNSKSETNDNEPPFSSSTAPLAKTNPLVECLLDCLRDAAQAYEATQRVYAAMLDQLTILTGESEAALVHSMLVLIADARLQSPGFSQNVVCLSDDNDWNAVLSMEWVTEMLVHAAKCEHLDDAVALQQSVVAAQRAGMSIAAAEKLHAELEQKETELVEQLVQEETKQVLDMCGLGALALTWKRWKEVQTSTSKQGTIVAMASYPGLSAAEMEAGMKEFYASLYSPPIPSLETTVKDPSARRRARSQMAEAVCDVYERIYDSAMASSSAYTDTSFLGHTPDRVRTLFSA